MDLWGRPRAALIGALAVILFGAFFLALDSYEPVYHKKGLSRWVRQLNESDPEGREAAVAAIRAMAKRAVPVLIAQLHERDRGPRKAIIWFTGHFPSLRDTYVSVEVERGYAASALGAMGPAAKAAIPPLVTASIETNSFCAARAKAALIQIGQDREGLAALPSPETGNLTNWLLRAEILLALGSNVQASADQMVEAIGKDGTRRLAIVDALGWNKREPSASVLLLSGLLKQEKPHCPWARVRPTFPYSSMKIVEKPWGREIWVAVTPEYALKIIEFNKGSRSSLQYHKVKHEHIYVDRGVAEMEWENDQGQMEKLVLKAGDVVENKPGRKHRTTAIEDVRFIEVSTPHLDDVVRVEDDYNRQ